VLLAFESNFRFLKPRIVIFTGQALRGRKGKANMKTHNSFQTLVISTTMLISTTFALSPVQLRPTTAPVQLRPTVATENLPEQIHLSWSGRSLFIPLLK
jgi:hypothetical protein